MVRAAGITGVRKSCLILRFLLRLRLLNQAINWWIVSYPIGFREFGPEKKDLGRIIDPDKDDDQGACRPKSRCHAAVANVEADHMFADRKQHGSDRSTEPDILPFNGTIGQYFENDASDSYTTRPGNRGLCL